VTVNVRLSGELARICGSARLALDMTDGATVDDVRAALRKRVPALAGALDATLPLVRGAHVPPDRQLGNGDELALLLPAAGG
jgi:molybdopterin synthase catalytic subunit/molybdopterin synthase sulfur carrier subunit